MTALPPSGTSTRVTTADVERIAAGYGNEVARRQGTGRGIVLAWKDCHGSMDVAQELRDFELYTCFVGAQLEQVRATVAAIHEHGTADVVVLAEGLGRDWLIGRSRLLESFRRNAALMRSFLADDPQQALVAYHRREFDKDVVHPAALHNIRYLPLLVTALDEARLPLSIIVGADSEQRPRPAAELAKRMDEQVAKARAGKLAPAEVAELSAWFTRTMSFDSRLVVDTVAELVAAQWASGKQLAILNFGGSHFSVGVHPGFAPPFGAMLDLDTPAATFGQLLVYEAKSHPALIRRLEDLTERAHTLAWHVVRDPTSLAAFIEELAR